MLTGSAYAAAVLGIMYLSKEIKKAIENHKK